MRIRFAFSIALLVLLVGAKGWSAEGEPSFARAVPTWPVGAASNMNEFVRFETTFERTGAAMPVLRIAGSSVYRIRLNGEFLGYGPARAAKGWFRVDEWPLASARKGENHLEIEVSAYNCSNFYIPKWPGFLQAEVVVDNTVLAATPSDFKVFDTGRIQTVSKDYCVLMNII